MTIRAERAAGYATGYASALAVSACSAMLRLLVWGQWREKIECALTRSAICVAVIGPRWMNPENVSRLHDANDMVRHELVTALATRGLSMVPTPVEGAELPRAAHLPPALRPLVETWNVRSVTEDGWEDDTRRLIAEISTATGPDDAPACGAGAGPKVLPTTSVPVVTAPTRIIAIEAPGPVTIVVVTSPAVAIGMSVVRSGCG